MCLDDPGYEVDLYLTASLADAIRVVRRDLALPEALDSGRLEAIGSSGITRRLAAWLNLGSLAAIASKRED